MSPPTKPNPAATAAPDAAGLAAAVVDDWFVREVLPLKPALMRLLRRHWRSSDEFHALDEVLRADVEYLDTRSLGEWRVAGRTDDDGVWIVRFTSDLNPASYALYERDTHRLTKRYDCYPDLANRAEAPPARTQA